MSIIYKGEIVKISGPVIDVRFSGKLPPINTLLTIEEADKHIEVAMHVGNNTVRAIALEATEGLSCGLKVVSDGNGIMVPVGDEVIGRVVDVLGRPIDGKGEIKADHKLPIHREPPSLYEQNLQLRYSKQVLRLSTYSFLIQRVVKSVFSVVLVLVKPFLLWK